MWAGVDVGGRRKGFHVAVVDTTGVVAGPARRQTAGEVVDSLAPHAPRVVAIDSPRSPAPVGALSREGERLLVAARVCGIRYTPDRAGLARNRTYYEWIENGFELYHELQEAGFHTIECFPTASWSRLLAPRRTERRSRWSTRALASLDLQGVPARLGQDGRDAVVAAVTARLYEARATEAFGDIVVPKPLPA